MADYDKMAKDSTDAARYEEVKKQIKEAKADLRYAHSNIGLPAFVSGASFVGGGVRSANTDGDACSVGMITIGAICALIALAKGCYCHSAIHEVETLTEELKGPEAVVQKK